MRKPWVEFGMGDALPCPMCGSRGLERFANLIECEDCEHQGTAQEGPEFMCDWREAINDWNIAAGGEDWHQRSPEQLAKLGFAAA